MPQKDYEAQAQAIAQQILARAQKTLDPYFQARAEFVGVARRAPADRITQTVLEATDAAVGTFGGSVPTEAYTGAMKEYVPSPGGDKLLYENGVIADIKTGNVLYKPGAAVAGSQAGCSRSRTSGRIKKPTRGASGYGHRVMSEVKADSNRRPEGSPMTFSTL